jgi:hypothetical protein
MNKIMKTQIVIDLDSTVLREYDCIIPMMKGNFIYVHDTDYVVVSVIFDVEQDSYIILVQ